MMGSKNAPDGLSRPAGLCPHGIPLRRTLENNNAGRGSDVARVVSETQGHAAARAPSTRLSHSAIWFQLAKIWLTTGRRIRHFIDVLMLAVIFHWRV